MKSALPWILLGVGVAGTVGVIVVMKKKGAPAQLPGAMPGFSPPSVLTPSVQAKVATEIAKTADPAKLQVLAAGLQKSGAVKEATEALKKAAQISGKPVGVPGNASLPPITITPGPTPGSEPVITTTPITITPGGGSPTTYKVVSGDIPGAIAKRFGVALSALAKANGANQARIMGGKINLGETLKLPTGVTDSGPASHAKGMAL